MSRSIHVTERQRRKDKILNRDDSDGINPELSKLDELSLKKSGVKDTETWRRAAAKAGGFKYTKVTFTEAGWSFRKQKTRGMISDVPGEVIPVKKKRA